MASADNERKNKQRIAELIKIFCHPIWRDLYPRIPLTNQTSLIPLAEYFDETGNREWYQELLGKHKIANGLEDILKRLLLLDFSVLKEQEAHFTNTLMAKKLAAETKGLAAAREIKSVTDKELPPQSILFWDNGKLRQEYAQTLALRSIQTINNFGQYLLENLIKRKLDEARIKYKVTNGNMTLHTAYPELITAHQLLGKSSDCDQIYATCLSEHNTQAAEYKAILDKFTNDYGLQVSTNETGTGIYLPEQSQPEYKADSIEPHTLEFFQRRLAKLQTKLNEEQEAWLNKIRTLRRRSFTVDYETGENNYTNLVISHAEWGTRKAPVYGTLGIPGKTVKLAVEEALKAVPETPPLPEAPSPPETISTYAKTHYPKYNLLFDANTLIRLATPRSTRTWLDLVLVTSKLPNIGKIIIPSHIADWELRGKVTKLNAKGEVELITIDPSIKAHADQMALNELLNSATRNILQPDGSYLTIPGNNPDIVITDSQNQQNLSQKLLKIKQSCGADTRRLESELKLFRETDGNNAGEYFAEEYCRAQSDLPSLIITSDLSLMNAKQIERANTGLSHTAGGQGIGYCTTLGFLNGLCGNSAYNVTPLVNQIGGDENTARVERIVTAINKRQEKKIPTDRREDVALRGFNTSGAPEMDISQFIEAGFREAGGIAAILPLLAKSRDSLAMGAAASNRPGR